MSTPVDVLADLLLLVGVLLIGLAGVGLLRLPDAYTRMNAAGKAGGLGVVSMVAGSALAVADGEAATKAVLAIILQLLTVPVGSFAIAWAAYRAATPLDPSTAYDELATQQTDIDQGAPGPPTPTAPSEEPPQPPA